MRRELNIANPVDMNADHSHHTFPFINFKFFISTINIYIKTWNLMTYQKTRPKSPNLKSFLCAVSWVMSGGVCPEP